MGSTKNGKVTRRGQALQSEVTRPQDWSIWGMEMEHPSFWENQKLPPPHTDIIYKYYALLYLCLYLYIYIYILLGDIVNIYIYFGQCHFSLFVDAVLTSSWGIIQLFGVAFGETSGHRPWVAQQHRFVPPPRFSFSKLWVNKPHISKWIALRILVILILLSGYITYKLLVTSACKLYIRWILMSSVSLLVIGYN